MLLYHHKIAFWLMISNWSMKFDKWSGIVRDEWLMDGDWDLDILPFALVIVFVVR